MKNFGTTSDAREARLYTLRHDSGFQLDIADFGGTVVNLLVPDRDGKLADISLGFDNVADYATRSPYFGALIGRVGNRTAHGRFTLGGKTYKLATNNEPGGIPCHLHGGPIGFDKVYWNVQDSSTAGAPALRLTHRSPAGHEGYPGNLDVEVIYTLESACSLRIDYRATCDEVTPVNLTNHTYFNLGGESGGTILDHELQIAAETYTPVDAGLIPTGELAPVVGTAFDFTRPHRIGARIEEVDAQLTYAGGYDHNFVLAAAPRARPELAATVYEPQSGRVMDVLTTEPGVQFYSGNFLDGSLPNKTGGCYARRSGFCLETQHFPDALNQPAFPSILLHPGATYRSTTIYRFSVR